LNDNNQHIATGVRSVISTQPAERAAELQKALEGSGLEFFNVPMIRTETVILQPETRKIIEQTERFDLLIFTSRNGVKAFFELLTLTGKTFPKKVKTAVIGKGTARELEHVFGPADFIQPGNTSRDFAVYLKNKVLKGGEKILLAMGNLAPDFLQKELSAVASVQRINVYKTFPIETYNRSVIQKVLENRYGLLVFSSPSAFNRFYEIYQKEKSKAPLRIVTIGQATTGVVLNTTQAFILTAKKPGTEGLLNEIKKYFHLKS